MKANELWTLISSGNILVQSEVIFQFKRQQTDCNFEIYTNDTIPIKSHDYFFYVIGLEFIHTEADETNLLSNVLLIYLLLRIALLLHINKPQYLRNQGRFTHP